MCTRSFYEQKATVGMPGRPLWPVGDYGGQNVLRDPRNRGIAVAAFRPPMGDTVTGCFGHAPHTKHDLGQTNAHVRAKRPQHQWHWHRRGPVPAVALGHQNCRRTSSSRHRRRRRWCRCCRCCRPARLLHRPLVGVHGLDRPDPGAVDRCALRYLGSSPLALPDRASLAAEVNVALAGSAAPRAGDTVRHDLRDVIDLLPGALARRLAARLAEHLQQPAAVAGLLAAGATSPLAL